MSPQRCLVCRQRLARSRGVCPPCYQAQHRRIRAGETTDAQLVAVGQRSPAKEHGGFAGKLTKLFTKHR
jgi:hypothetical protein